jgi:DNA-binding XRE family transcriptional regulator
MTKVRFLDSSTIEVVALDGEKFTLKPQLPVHHTKQKAISDSLAIAFDENFSNDKSSMIYWVLMKSLTDTGLGFSYEASERSADRERIGAKIRQLRESKGMEAKQLAMLANIDPANLSRIEQGRYSVGLDILAKISQTLGVKVDLVEV